MRKATQVECLESLRLAKFTQKPSSVTHLGLLGLGFYVNNIFRLASNPLVCQLLARFLGVLPAHSTFYQNLLVMAHLGEVHKIICHS